MVEREDYSGPFAAEGRPALAVALAGVDPARLTALQQRWLSYWIDRYAGPPPTRSMTGKAKLVVGTSVVEVVVAGRTVFSRSPDLVKAATEIEPVTLEVDVPTEEAVFIRIHALGFAASDRIWMSEIAEAWSVLLPGHRYEVGHGVIKRTAANETICVLVEGVPEGVTASPRQWSMHFGVVAWPPPVEIQPTEPGAYVIVLREEGAERVRYEPAGCPVVGS